MNYLLECIKRHDLKVISTTRMCQLLSVPEWELLHYVEPLLNTGQISFYGENSYGIDLWLCSINADLVKGSEPFAKSRFIRAKRFWDGRSISSQQTARFDGFYSNVRSSGFTSDLIRQVVDCMHLLAKGKTENDIRNYGYVLNLHDIDEWYAAISQHYELFAMKVIDDDEFTAYKIIDRLGASPQVIGFTNTKRLKSFMTAIGGFVFSQDKLEVDNFIQIYNLAASRFVFSPLSASELKTHSLFQSNDEPSFVLFYGDDESIYRGCIFRDTDVHTAPEYTEWNASIDHVHCVDFATCEILEAVLGDNVYGQEREIVTSTQRSHLVELFEKQQSVARMEKEGNIQSLKQV